MFEIQNSDLSLSQILCGMSLVSLSDMTLLLDVLLLDYF